MIRGEKVFLRPVKYEDWQKTINWRNDLEFNSLIMSHPFPVTEELEREWIKGVLEDKNDNSVYFAICSKDSEELVGITKLYQINGISRTCYFGIYIGSETNREKGFGKEAMRLVINYAFNSLNLRKMLVEVVEINQTAISLYKKLGFKKEGDLKEQFYSNGKYQDVKIMSFIQKDKNFSHN